MSYLLGVWTSVEIFGALLRSLAAGGAHMRLARFGGLPLPCWSTSRSVLTQTRRRMLSPKTWESMTLVVAGEACPPELVEAGGPGAHDDAYAPAPENTVVRLMSRWYSGVTGN